jgi:hypothetical protein
MRFVLAIISLACVSSLSPALAERISTDDDTEVQPVPPNPASDACASVAAFTIAPQVFQPGDEKDLPQWIQACNAHPDASMCRDTIRLINANRKEVPPGLDCGSRPST